MTSPAKFSFIELGTGPRSKKVDEAIARQHGHDRQIAEPAFGSEGFTPWVSEPDENAGPERLHTAEELARAVEEARQTAAAETEAAIRQAMADDIEQRRSELIQAIRTQLEAQSAAFDDKLEAYAHTAQRLAAALAKAVIPRALEKCPLMDITEILKATLARLSAEPVIDVRFSPGEADIGKAVLADIARDLGLSNDVVSAADSLVAEGSVQIRWQGGVIDHGWQVLYAEALSMIGHWLGEASESPAADDQMTDAVEPVPDPSMDNEGPADGSSPENE
jgi:hypothetical protein